MCSHYFKLYRAHVISFISSNLGEFFESWILKDSINNQEKKKRIVVLLSRCLWALIRSWALIRGWALIWINTVISIHTYYYENEGEGRKEKRISKGIFKFQETRQCEPSMKQDYMYLQLRPLLQTDSQTQLPWSALSPPKKRYKTTFEHRGVTSYDESKWCPRLHYFI